MNPDAELYRLALRLQRLAARHRPDLLADAVALAVKAQPCRHGPGFSSVRWYGVPYSFTGGQAKAVEILWTAWQNGTPDVRQDYILVTAGIESERLCDVFKGHPAWNALIVAGGSKGTYRLADGPPAEKGPAEK